MAFTNRRSRMDRARLVGRHLDYRRASCYDLVQMAACSREMGLHGAHGLGCTMGSVLSVGGDIWPEYDWKLRRWSSMVARRFHVVGNQRTSQPGGDQEDCEGQWTGVITLASSRVSSLLYLPGRFRDRPGKLISLPRN